MFAIIRTGGKQYRVQAGDTVRVQKLEKNPGETFDLTDVLMLGGDKSFFGTPMVKDAKVTVTVARQGKEAKITVFKKKRRQGYRRTLGHRQDFTELFVVSITSPEGQSTKAENKAQVVDPKKKEARLLALTESLKASGGKKAVVEAKKKKAASKTAAKSKKAAAPKKVGAKKTKAKAGAKKTGAKKAAKKTKK